MARSFAFVFLLLTATATHLALGQAAYPAKPVKIVVPVTTGGPSDLVARIVADKLAAALGKPVIIENVPGASQSIGAGAVAKADPDGYTLLQAAANMAINPILMPDLRYDTVKDFAPVSLTHLTPYVFAVSPQSPVKTLAELVKHVRENPGKITYGTTGQGSPQQLATLLFAQALALGEMTEVQYKGSSAAHPDLISNRITFMIDPLAAGSGHIRAGTLRALAVTTPQRTDAAPGVPTMKEAGLGDFELVLYTGVLGPRGMPAPVVERVNAEFAKAVQLPEIRQVYAKVGAAPAASTPDAFAAHIRSEMAKLGKLVELSGARID